MSPSTFSPIVAIEVEGHGVYPKSITADISKFRDCGALMNVIALFQVDHNRTIKRLPPRGILPINWVLQHADSFPVDILLDEDLMVSGGVEKLQKKALELLNKG